jgi:hypothetical protein
MRVRPPTAAALLLWFAQQLTGGPIDEVQLGASLTGHGFITIVRTGRRGYVRQPMLNVYSRIWAFEYDVTAHVP